MSNDTSKNWMIYGAYGYTGIPNTLVYCALPASKLLGADFLSDRAGYKVKVGR